MNILGFTNHTGSAHWRLQSIANYINSRTIHEFGVFDSKLWTGDVIGADIVIAQMWRNPKGVKEAQSQGAKVIYEADDIILGVGGKDRKELMDMSEKLQKKTAETISLCDAVTVTTPELGEHYKQFNDNVYVLPNYMDFVWWGEPLKIKRNGEIRIGWAGSKSHREDLEMIAPVIKRVLDKYDNARFIYCGYGGYGSNKESTSLGYGRDLFSDIPVSRREYVVGVPLEYWPIKSKTLGIDIAISPLLDDEFNRGKSNIKYFEYSANLWPGVYSDTCVYKNIKHDKTGLKAKTKDDWFKQISRLVESEKLRQDLATNAIRDVFINYNIEDHYEEWIRLWQTLLQSQ